MTTYLIDTNVISEWMRPKPNKKIHDWLSGVPVLATYVSVLTLGEIRKGVEMMRDKKRKQIFINWLDQELQDYFKTRVLEITQPVADRWGRLLADEGRPLPAIDSLIAATALHYDLTVVTRNTKHFNFSSLSVLNPWEL